MWWAALGVAMLVVGAGCDDGADGSQGGSTDGSASVATGPISPSFVDMLRLVPDTPANRAILLDYVSFDRARGGEPAATAADDLQLLASNTAQHVQMPSIGRGLEDPEFAAAAGFDTRQVAAALGQYAFDGFVFLAGSMDPATVSAAVQASQTSEAGAPTVTVDGTYTIVAVGEEGSGSLREMSVLRPSGEGLRWAIGNGALIAGVTDAQVRESRRSADSGTSLAYAVDYAAVATALDAAGAVNASILDEYPQQQEASGEAADEAWEVLGIGESFAGETSTVTLVFRYADAGTAADQMAAFPAHLDDVSAVRGSPWSEAFTLEDIHADGLTVIATLHSTAPGGVRTALMQRDNLFTFG